MSDQEQQTWGWSNVEPQKWDFDALKSTLDEFTLTLSKRGYPDEYVCTGDVWTRIRDTANVAHKKGYGNDELVNICGVPVKTFATVTECEEYALAIHITLGRKVQVIK